MIVSHCVHSVENEWIAEVFGDVNSPIYYAILKRSTANIFRECISSLPMARWTNKNWSAETQKLYKFNLIVGINKFISLYRRV